MWIIKSIQEIKRLWYFDNWCFVNIYWFIIHKKFKWFKVKPVILLKSCLLNWKIFIYFMILSIIVIFLKLLILLIKWFLEIIVEENYCICWINKIWFFVLKWTSFESFAFLLNKKTMRNDDSFKEKKLRFVLLIKHHKTYQINKCQKIVIFFTKKTFFSAIIKACFCVMTKFKHFELVQLNVFSFAFLCFKRK